MLNHKLLSEIEEKSIVSYLINNTGFLYNKSLINIKLLFNSFNDDINVLGIINKLLAVFNDYSSSYQMEISLLIKYKELYKKNDRVLNKDELIKYFNIIEDNVIDSSIVSSDIDNYINYMLSRLKLIKYNMRLVHSLALKYSNKVHLEYEELFEEGLKGLVKAVDNFNPQKGNRFSTYATVVIRSTMLTYIDKNISLLYTGSNFFYKLKKFNDKVNELEILEGRKLSVKEITDRLSIDKELVIIYMMFPNRLVSLDSTIDDNEDLTFKDLLCSDVDVENVLKSISDNKIIEKVLSCLSETEIQIILLYYGFNEDNRPYTAREISKKLKLDMRYVINIHNLLLSKIRHMLINDASFRDYKNNGIGMISEWNNEKSLLRISK